MRARLKRGNPPPAASPAIMEMVKGPGLAVFSSEFFRPADFACEHCHELIVISQTLLGGLDELQRNVGRLGVGSLIRILCGYRCRRFNSNNGRAPESAHLDGQAADILIPGLTVPRMVVEAEKVAVFHRSGIGRYSLGFIHVDVKPRFWRWSG